MAATADASSAPWDVDADDSLNKTAVLLRRLNELKTWQREQEDRLRDQEELQGQQDIESASGRERFNAVQY